MTNDQTARSARRIATVVAVPVALLTGVVVFQMLKPSPPPEPQASPSPSPRPQATSPVDMTAPTLDERQSTVCLALLSQLPGEIRSLERRPVTAGHEQNAAYGDPAIKVSCGGEQPAVDPSGRVLTLNGVCWQPDAAGGRWFTVDREVPVVVTVPSRYEGPAEWVIQFSAPIISSILSVEAPWGCKQP